MKRCLLPAIAIAFSLSCLSQAPDHLGSDCKPYFNSTEVKVMDSVFADRNISFAGKNIGLVQKDVIAIHFSDKLFPVTKEAFFKDWEVQKSKNYIYHLIRLDASDKEFTRGLDYIIVKCDAKFRKKLTTDLDERVINLFQNRNRHYSGLGADAGTDSSAALTIADAAFLNDIYKYEKVKFDFTGKRIVILDPHVRDSTQFVNKMTFMAKVREDLKNYCVSRPGRLYVMTSMQKEETGYDAMIVYYDKMDFVNDYIATIKNNGYPVKRKKF